MEQQLIFFSYARADAAEFALELATDLKSAGANVWVDQLNLRGGEKYNTAIEKALEASTHVLFIVSKKSIVSEYVLAEVHYALEEGKVIIPLITYECKLPLRLRGLQKINFTDKYDKEFGLLLNALDIAFTNKSNPVTQKADSSNSASINYNSLKAEKLKAEGNYLYEKRKYEEAIAKYTEAIELKTDYADAYYNRGTAYYYLTNFSQSVTDCTKAIELNANVGDAYYVRGLAYVGLRNFRKAIIEYNKAIELTPTHAMAYYFRGCAYDMLKNYNQAIADYTKVIELIPDYALAYYHRGNAYLGLNYLKKAIAEYNKAIRHKPDKSDEASVYFSRGLVKQGIGNSKGACEDYKRSCDLGNKNACKEYNKLRK